MMEDKCFRCEIIPCVDFFAEGDRLCGGELFILQEHIRQNRLLPCTPGCVLYACCKLRRGAYETLEGLGEAEYSTFLVILEQCLYDLKASLFLALTGHYRGAFQLLRPVLENAIAALWFKAKPHVETKQKSQAASSALEDWMAGKCKSPSFSDMVQELSNEFLLVDVRAKREWRKLIEQMHPFKLPLSAPRIRDVWDELNEYLHPYFRTTELGKRFASQLSPDCPAHVVWDRRAYWEWLQLFQNISDIILRLLVGLFPGSAETEAGKNGLTILKVLEQAQREEGQGVIECNHLCDFLATVAIDEPEDLNDSEERSLQE